MTNRKTFKFITTMVVMLAFVIGAISLFGALNVSAAPGTGSYDVNGDGSNETAYKIYNANDLLWFSQQVSEGNNTINGVLMNDIDLSTVCSPTIGNWLPIGNNSKYYKGSFDGRGFTVKNLYYNNTADNGKQAGLFGYIFATSTIRNITVTGEITAYRNSGGIIGSGMGSGNTDPLIKNCVNYVNVTVTDRDAGGILGSGAGEIIGCVNYGTIKANLYAGGIIGFGYDNIIQDCINAGEIAGFSMGHMNQDKKSVSNFLNIGTATRDVSDKTVVNCYSIQNSNLAGVTTISAEDENVKNGAIAYSLGSNWGQEIGVDAFPVLGGMKVYYTIDPTSICSNPTYYYSNTENTSTIHDTSLGAEAFTNGVCNNCGYVCVHGSETFTYSNPTATTHDATYSCCNKVVTLSHEYHRVNNFVCACGQTTILKVEVYPTAAHEYGSSHTSVNVTGGKVVVLGNESEVITGTWTWAGNSTAAVFTPDAQYAGLFPDLGAQSVNITVTATTPVITITSPSPSAMPGMKLNLNITATNPHTDTPATLPTSFTYKYKIGEGGTLQSFSGSTFTIPADVALGDKLYIYVENAAESGRYATATSNVVEILIGQIDYTDDIENVQTNLDNAIAELKAADVKNADELAQAITNLNSAIEAAKTAAQNADGTLRTELTDKIDAADAALDAKIAQVQTNLNDAVAKLEAVDKKNADELAQAIIDLNLAIEAAQAAAEAYAKAGDDALRTELTDKIDVADALLQNNIDLVQKNLDDAVAKLEAVDKKNADELAQAIIDLNLAIEAAQAAAEAYAKAGDDALGAALTKKIDDADALLQNNIDLVQKNLDDAVAKLEAVDKKNAEALAQAIIDLNLAIETAQAAAEAYAKAGDDALGAALTKKIDDADAILQENIDKVQENLDTQVDRLDKVDKENAEALAEAIKELQATIKAMGSVAKSVAKQGDKELREELIAKIDAADKALAEAVKAVQDNLDNAKNELNQAIANGDTKLDGKISALNSALEAAKAVLDAADEDINGKLDEARATLEAAISAVQKKLDDTKAALEASDKALAKADEDNRAELDAKDRKLTAASVVAIVLGSIGLLGNGGLIAWIIVDKKKLHK